MGLYLMAMEGMVLRYDDWSYELRLAPYFDKESMDCPNANGHNGHDGGGCGIIGILVAAVAFVCILWIIFSN